MVPSLSAASIRVGVAGWDYPDWNGIVYPAMLPRMDRLSYLARHVDVIEVNSTFYRPVSPRRAESWLRRTDPHPRFVFTAKAHRALTHEARRPGLELEDTLAGLAPLLEANRLSALLLQFPQSFHDTTTSRSHIERLVERMHGWPVVVELRHVSWEQEGVPEWLSERRVGWCAVDQPKIGRSTARILPWVTSPIGYLRLHGRNTETWFRPQAGRDARYDYLYGTEQVTKLAAVAREMADGSKEMVVVQNNHFRGKALVNALQMRHLLEAARPRAPEELVAAYPQLAPHVEVTRHRLF